MNCSNCKKQIPEDSKFCIFCGNTIVKESISKTKGKGREELKLEKENKVLKNNDDQKKIKIYKNKSENNNVKYYPNQSSKIFKPKTLAIVLSVLLLLFFISTTVTSSILYIKDKDNRLIRKDLDIIQENYDELIIENNSLERSYNGLQTEYDILFEKSKYFPEDPEDYITLLGKIEESWGYLLNQIYEIRLSKISNSHIEYSENLIDYYENLQKEVDILNQAYYGKIIELEIELRDNYLDLERKMNDGRISYETYSANWDTNYLNYRNASDANQNDYNGKFKKIVEKYEEQINIDYDDHMNELKTADTDYYTRYEEIEELFKGVCKDYGIEVPVYGWHEEEDFKTFGIKEIVDKYEKELEELY